jgi:hypothetical protein
MSGRGEAPGVQRVERLSWVQSSILGRCAPHLATLMPLSQRVRPLPTIQEEHRSRCSAMTSDVRELRRIIERAVIIATRFSQSTFPRLRRPHEIARGAAAR